MDNCPICHNKITDRGFRGSAGVNEYGDPKPFWSEDPLLTHMGLAGAEYKGKDPSRVLHIIELQNYYKNLEEQILDEENRTEFLEITNKEPLRHVHIEQLRISVEKCLEATGFTIADYFKYDRIGNETETEQIDWTDINRSNGLPLLPKKVPIRALHIEELRRGLLIIWIEKFNVTIPATYVDLDNTIVMPAAGISPVDFSKSFVGDKGTHRFAYRYDYSETYGSVGWLRYRLLGKATEEIEDGSSYIHMQAESECHLTSSSYPHPTRNVYNYMYIRLPYFATNLWKVTSNTKLLFDTAFNIVHTGNCPNNYAYIEVLVTFSDYFGFSRRILYAHGFNIAAPDFLLTDTEMDNFDRNLYNDYFTKYGHFPPSNAYVKQIHFWIRTRADAKWTIDKDGYSSVEMTVDNIKLMNRD